MPATTTPPTPCAPNFSTAVVGILTQWAYLRPDLQSVHVCQLQFEEAIFAAALRAKGITVERVAWDDPSVDWSRFRAVIFRSTWNYSTIPVDFSNWLARVEARTELLNGAAQVRWNLDKRYLLELEQRGIRIVPTLAIPSKDPRSLAEIMAQANWSGCVIKPVVSAGARNTYRVHPGGEQEMQPYWQVCITQESMMVQPFMASILSEGEISVMVVDGKCTHAVRKVAKRGDFRVQDDHGGTVKSHELTAEQAQFAQAVVAACPTLPCYARVDLVHTNDGGLALMEVELIEPELFFRFDPGCASALADAVADRLRLPQTVC